MIAHIRSWLADRQYRKAFRDLDIREAKAKQANDNRALGRVRQERRDRLHAGLKSAAGWRGSMAR